MSGRLTPAPYALGTLIIEPGDRVRVIRAWGGPGPVGTFAGWTAGEHEEDDTLVVDGEPLAPGDRIEPAAPADWTPTHHERHGPELMAIEDGSDDGSVGLYTALEASDSCRRQGRRPRRRLLADGSVWFGGGDDGCHPSIWLDDEPVDITADVWAIEPAEGDAS